MKHWILSCFMLLSLAACKQSEQKQTHIMAASVEELVHSPAEFADKEVAIEGMVTHVCRHGGQKCFVLGKDGSTQIRIVPAGDIDEFPVELEGSTVAFKGTFRMLNAEEAEAHLEDHESKDHHSVEMAHSEAEKAEVFLEASELKELPL